jgi:hypothetical protein
LSRKKRFYILKASQVHSLQAIGLKPVMAGYHKGVQYQIKLDKKHINAIFKVEFIPDLTREARKIHSEPDCLSFSLHTLFFSRYPRFRRSEKTCIDPQTQKKEDTVKSVGCAVLFCIFVAVPFTVTSGVGVPQQMFYQGYLSDSEGLPLDSVVSMTFSIYEDSSVSADLLWRETQMEVMVSHGLFNVLLGVVDPLPDSVFDEGACVRPGKWLGVAVGSDPEIQPRTRLVTVPYAYRVATVDAASGGDVYGEVRVHNKVTVGSQKEDEKCGDKYRAGYFVITDGEFPVVVADGGTQQVGVGKVDPDAQFHVETLNHEISGSFRSHRLSSSARVVRAEFDGKGEVDAVAVYGRSQPADYFGYGGVFEGGYAGMAGLVHPTGDSCYYGVKGKAIGGGGRKFGVKGKATGVGKNCGVLGMASGPGLNFGLCGVAEGSKGFSCGIFGTAGGSDSSLAGLFVGDVVVTGWLSKGAGCFKIDHPLDPENKYLYHSFVESPDMMNVYNGNVLLDSQGEAVVELPDYFDAVNQDFRYQLTCIGQFAPVYVAQEISRNSFKIAGGEPGMTVSWQVTGIRRDPYAEANRIQVEVEKSPEEQGKYLHPELYGLGQEYGIYFEHARLLEVQPLKENEERLDRR